MLVQCAKFKLNIFLLYIGVEGRSKLGNTLRTSYNPHGKFELNTYISLFSI